MNRVIALERDDDIVRELLAPFERVQPVSLSRRPRRPRRSRPLMLAAAIAGVAVLVFASLATAGAIGFGPLHGASISPNPPSLAGGATSALACNLIGQTAGQAEAALHQSGYRIEWRFQHWGSQSVQSADKNAPSGVTGGYSSEPQTVPADSIVWDIGADTRSANTFFVFVEAPNDPNAPTLTPPNCQGG
jgi:hypothetical protein